MSERSPAPLAGARLYDVQIRVDDLRPLVEARVGAGDPLRIAFDRYSDESERTGRPPSQETTLAALAAFESLSPERKGELLNGWQPFDLIPSKDEAVEVARDNDDVHRVLAINASGRGISSGQEWRLRNVTAVEVTIMAGVPKAQAVAALRAMLDRIDGQWEEMMGDVWCLGPFEQESGASVTPLTPELGGRKGDGAEYVTAA